MKKSTLIATFLVNLKRGLQMSQAEQIVLMTFREQHPKENFDIWNVELGDKWCQQVIRAEPKPSFVNVEKFILDIWDLH